MELKQILARQPGPEVAEQLSIYQQTLKGKTKQMKGMASELNMYEAQVKEYKYEIERLAKELQDAKKKYYMQKRKDQQSKWVGRGDTMRTELLRIFGGGGGGGGWGGGTPIYFLRMDVPPNKASFSGSSVLNRVYNLIFTS